MRVGLQAHAADLMAGNSFWTTRQLQQQNRGLWHSKVGAAAVQRERRKEQLERAKARREATRRERDGAAQGRRGEKPRARRRINAWNVFCSEQRFGDNRLSSQCPSRASVLTRWRELSREEVADLAANYTAIRAAAKCIVDESGTCRPTPSSGPSAERNSGNRF